MVENIQMLVDYRQKFFWVMQFSNLILRQFLKNLIQKGRGNGPLMPWQPISFAVV